MYKTPYIIILLLLCIYCTNPQISEIPGCTNKTACNFDESANLDDGSCELAEQNYDCENNCIVDFDCADECGGSSVVDECGECGGGGPVDNYDCDDNCLVDVDCAGECGGSAVVDECGDCGGEGPENNYDCSGNCIVVIDCAGICGGDSVEDECGVCGGDGIGDYDCNGICIATGNNLDDNGLDCSGVCGGNAVEDICGICDGNVYNLSGCTCPSGIFDECGICNGPGAIYECGCTGIQEGRCDCDGRREDCAGECGGSNFTDVCGNCGDWVVANNCKDDCRDCEGKCGGDAIVDCTGECDGDAVEDCSGVCGGSAVEDDCGVCGGVAEYELVWEDEFEGAGLDLDKWNIEEWSAGAFNEEEQAYTDEIDNIYVENGNLHIRALRETYDPDNNGVADAMYTSGRITTKHKGGWQYSKVEVKAQLPLGEGTWPAIWMLPTEDTYGGWPESGEIDIMEYVGNDPGKIHSSVHNATYYENLNQGGMPQPQTKSKNVDDVVSHIYKMIWKKNKITFYVDDAEIMVYNNLDTGFELWPFDQKFYLVLNLAIGGTWGGTVSPEIFPVEFIVDYVKVYQQPCD